MHLSSSPPPQPLSSEVPSYWQHFGEAEEQAETAHTSSSAVRDQTRMAQGQSRKSHRYIRQGSGVVEWIGGRSS